MKGAIIFGEEIFKDLITLLNSYTRDQFAGLTDTCFL